MTWSQLAWQADELTGSARYSNILIKPEDEVSVRTLACTGVRAWALS